MKNKDGCQKVIKNINICIVTDDQWLNGKTKVEKHKKKKVFMVSVEIID